VRGTIWASGFLLASAIGCTGIRTVEPDRFIPQYRPVSVMVWTAPTQVTIVSDPEIVGDTLVGRVFDERWTIALKDIVRVQARARDPGKTALFVGGTTASLVGLVYLLANNSGRPGQGLTAGVNCGSDYSVSTGSGLAPCDAGSR
jgi:hypothetical protein